MKRLNFLVAGGCGYIGSHVVNLLSSAGNEVVVVDNLSTGTKDALLNGEELIVGNIGDKKLLDTVFSTKKIDVIMHFAACIDVEESQSLPRKYFQNNIVQTFNLLEAMQNKGVKGFLFSSTASVYGDANGDIPVTEDSILSPTSVYGQSKLACEYLVSNMCREMGVQSTVLRYFNVAGAHPDKPLGQRGNNRKNLIFVACDTALGRRSEMSVYGSDYPTRDGSAVRDFIHVVDLAEVHYLAADHMLRNSQSLLLNCGYGTGFTVKEVIEAVRRESGNNFKVTTAPRRPGDIGVSIANADRLKKLLNWKPKHEDLNEIVSSALNWEKNAAKK